jgi:alcohol dehydrogenase
MHEFDFQSRTRIVFGPDKVDALGELAAELNGRRVLVVSDPGIQAAGHDDRGLKALRSAGLEAQLWDQVVENPTTANVEAGVAFARDYRPDLLVGLGGGSSMDCAKGINFIHTNGGRMEDYRGYGKATRPMLPMIAVPTTAGTGSETQSYALISGAETRLKMACGDAKAAFRVALLDPKLTLTQPPGVTALTGIDAISHALETYVTTRRNALSLAFSREAWRLLESNFLRVLAEPLDLEARAAMQLGASLAGLAIENSMLGAAHALANPLTQHFGVAHGQAVAAMLPHVIRYNGTVAEDSYGELWRMMADGRSESPASESGAPRILANSATANSATELLARSVLRLIEEAGLETRVSACGVPRESLAAMALDATKQWTGTFNPRPLDEGAFLRLYEAAY